jgi:hypothetical protein
VFWRGYDVYDATNVGFVSSGDQAQQAGTRFDTALRSNGNGGHVFGTALPDPEKEVLLEYLKSL